MVIQTGCITFVLGEVEITARYDVARPSWEAGERSDFREPTLAGGSGVSTREIVVQKHARVGKDGTRFVISNEQNGLDKAGDNNFGQGPDTLEGAFGITAI